MKFVEIFTDGACKGNQQRENYGGYGAILIYKNIEKKISGSKINTTNNEMELTAIIEALKQLKETKISVAIYSDSSYIVNCIKESWYKKWRLNGWKTSSKKDVENKKLWKELLDLYEKFDKVEFYKIKGHISEKSKEFVKWYGKFKDEEYNLTIEQYKRLNKYNDIADKLAVNAAMEKEVKNVVK